MIGCVRFHTDIRRDCFSRDQLTSIAVVASVVVLGEVSRNLSAAGQCAVGALHQAVDVGGHRWELLPRLVAGVQGVMGQARAISACCIVVEVEIHTYITNTLTSHAKHSMTILPLVPHVCLRDKVLLTTKHSSVTKYWF